jgi:hypothetical protein
MPEEIDVEDGAEVVIAREDGKETSERERPRERGGETRRGMRNEE